MEQMVSLRHKITGGPAVMTLEEMREKKKERGYSLEYLATLSDVPLSTLRKQKRNHGTVDGCSAGPAEFLRRWKL